MTLMKPSDRSSLGSLHFQQSVFVAYNSPPIHAIDFDALVRRLEKKPKLALFKPDRQKGEESGASRSRGVIRRLAAVEKHAFLC